MVGYPFNPFKPVSNLKITEHSKAVLLLWFSMLLVLVSVSVLFSPMCLDDIGS